MAMDDVRDRDEKELGSVRDRLRQLGGAVVIEEFPGALGDNSPFSDPTEEVQVQGEREVSFATRTILVERANRLAEGLAPLRGGGGKADPPGPAQGDARGAPLRPLPG